MIRAFVRAKRSERSSAAGIGSPISRLRRSATISRRAMESIEKVVSCAHFISILVCVNAFSIVPEKL